MLYIKKVVIGYDNDFFYWDIMQIIEKITIFVKAKFVQTKFRLKL